MPSSTVLQPVLRKRRSVNKLEVLDMVNQETEGKRDKIEEFLKTIEDRLATLEEEKDELKEYQRYDKMRRALEYQIHDRDLQDAQKKLSGMENKRKNSGEEAEKLRTDLQEAGEKAKLANKEVKDLKVKEASAKEERDTLNTELQAQTKKKTKLEFSLKDLRGEVAGDNNSKNEGFYELKKRKDKLQSERNDLCRKEMNLQQSLSSLKEELAKADQTLRSMAGKPILNGRDSVRKVLDTFREHGGQYKQIAESFYGLVIENFECEQSIYTAVEVTAGNRLFHHIVESDRVGMFILEEMNKSKLPGEVTFMPLNRLHVRNIDYPNTKDAIAMVSKLEYSEKYDTALRYIFGRTLICRNLEVATQLARTTGLDCVTLDGDQVSSKGSLTEQEQE